MYKYLMYNPQLLSPMVSRIEGPKYTEPGSCSILNLEPPSRRLSGSPKTGGFRVYLPPKPQAWAHAGRHIGLVEGDTSNPIEDLLPAQELSI